MGNPDVGRSVVVGPQVGRQSPGRVGAGLLSLAEDGGQLPGGVAATASRSRTRPQKEHFVSWSRKGMRRRCCRAARSQREVSWLLLPARLQLQGLGAIRGRSDLLGWLVPSRISVCVCVAQVGQAALGACHAVRSSRSVILRDATAELLFSSGHVGVASVVIHRPQACCTGRLETRKAAGKWCRICLS